MILPSVDDIKAPPILIHSQQALPQSLSKYMHVLCFQIPVDHDFIGRRMVFNQFCLN